MRKNIVTTLLMTCCLFFMSFSAYADNVNALFHSTNDPVGGNPKGSITIVEFFDYNCPHCEHVVSTVSSIISANPDVRLVYKDLPILGPDSVLAARAALAAQRQGQYVKFNKALFAAGAGYTQSSLSTLAEQNGLNVTKFQNDINNGSVTAQLKANLALAQDLNIPGTPAFYIGKTNATNMKDVIYMAGEVSASDLQNAVDSVKK